MHLPSHASSCGQVSSRRSLPKRSSLRNMVGRPVRNCCGFVNRCRCMHAPVASHPAHACGLDDADGTASRTRQRVRGGCQRRRYSSTPNN